MSSFPPLSPDVSQGPIIWLFTWRDTSRAGQAPTKQRSEGESFKRKKNNKNKRRLPTSLLVELSQSRVAGVCSSQSMPFCTILKPSASGTSLWRKALWRLCLLQQEDKIMDGEEIFLIEKDLKHTQKKKDKKKTDKRHTNKKSEWFVCMVHDVLGTSPGQQIHWYFTKLSEVSMCALWMSEIGWLAPWKERRRFSFFVWEGEEMDWWMVRGWYQCCCGLNGFLGGNSTCVSPGGSVRMGQDGSSCLPVLSGTQTEGGWGFSGAFEGLGFDHRKKVDVSFGQWPRDQYFYPPGHCMTGAFFGVFGAATKCAMCYVAWFIIFLQATKLICSPIV